MLIEGKESLASKADNNLNLVWVTKPRTICSDGQHMVSIVGTVMLKGIGRQSWDILTISE
jgi:hypothetical protein